MDDRDRLELHEMPGRYGDMIDNCDWSGLANIFTEGASFVVNDRTLSGLGEIQTYMSTHTGLPLTHLMTNVYVDETSDDVVLYSRVIALHSNGTTSSGQYRDVVVKGTDGWRVQSRSYVSTPRQRNKSE